jgi:Ca-activated chloride channel family protein
MSGEWENQKKINLARKTLYDIVDSLNDKKNIQMALRIYGHQSPVPPQDCEDTKLEVPFRNNNANAIKQKLNFIDPKGTTPISYSLEQGANDFPGRCPNCRNIIIVITDGKEECEGDPCAISKQLQKKGIILKPFIIGIGIDKNFEKSFECIGNYYNASSEHQFTKMMNVVVRQALNSTTAQVNLLDKSGRPNETNVPMTFYDEYSGNLKDNYIHTINYRGNPDTIILDPLLSYNMTVHTLPSVKVKNIKVTSGRHTIIAADAPMGSLIVKPTGGNQYSGLRFRVNQKGKSNTLCYQEIDREQRYLVGNYHVEIPVLPTLNVDVNIKQSHTTTIEIPRPGIVNLMMQSPGYGSLFKYNNGRLEWVYNVRNDVTRENLTLLPGTYAVVFRPKNARKSVYSITRNFEIKSGSAITVKLY